MQSQVLLRYSIATGEVKDWIIPVPVWSEYCSIKCVSNVNMLSMDLFSENRQLDAYSNYNYGFSLSSSSSSATLSNSSIKLNGWKNIILEVENDIIIDGILKAQITFQGN